MQQALTRRALMGAAAGATLVGAAPTLAAPSDAMGNLDGVGIAEAIQSGLVRAHEIIDAAIARAQRVNGGRHGLNFLVRDTFRTASQRAHGALSGTLAGVPTLIKDLTNVAGVRTAYGSRAYLNNIATTTDPLVTAMEAAGLISIGKSATPEFGLTAVTEPMAFKPTRNPWALDMSPGGSSGGAAAAVAAGVVPIAHGSDGGGSLRIPASCCGLFSLKPSRGRLVGAQPPFLGVHYRVTDGCISRSVRDSAAWLDAMEQKSGQYALPPVGLVTGPSTKRLRIGVQVTDYAGLNPDPEVYRVLKETVSLCESLGHIVFGKSIPISMPAFSDAFGLTWSMSAQTSRTSAIGMLPPGATLSDYLEPLTLSLAAFADAAGPQSVQIGSPAILQLEAAAAAYNAAFVDMDVYLTPTLARLPAAIGDFSPQLPASFRSLREYSPFTSLQNVSGAPAMSVPLGYGPGLLPIGMHFSARPGEEQKLLELAFELEQARPWQPWATRFPKVWTG